MKKNFILTTFLVAAIALTISSCSKEQKFITILEGNWTVTSELDNTGTPIVPATGQTITTTYAFLDCSTKEDQENCTYIYKQTTVTTPPGGGAVVTSYNSRTGSYQVQAESNLIMDGAVFVVSSVGKKSLVIYPFASPKALVTLSKN